MSKWVAVLAIAAAQIVTASSCGGSGEQCCNIQINNPNIGDCEEKREVCWEGMCSICGMNGKIGCPDAPACDPGNSLNADGWCGFDGSVPWVDVCEPDCTGRTACLNSKCVPCGDNGQPNCGGDPRWQCDDGNVVNEDGWCATEVVKHVVDTSECGDPEWACCNADQMAYLKTDNPCSKSSNGVCCDGICKEGGCGDEKSGKSGKSGKFSYKRW